MLCKKRTKIIVIIIHYGYIYLIRISKYFENTVSDITSKSGEQI